MTAPAFSMLTFQILFACFADWKGGILKKSFINLWIRGENRVTPVFSFFTLRLDLVIIFTKFY